MIGYFSWTIFLLVSIILTNVRSQAPSSPSRGDFLLPTLSRNEPPKPTISPDLAHYFQLPDAGARRFVSSYFPGLVPPPTFEIADPQQQQLLAAARSSGLPLNGLLTSGNGGNALAQLQQTGALNGASGNIAAGALQALLGNGGPPAGLPLTPGFSVRPANSVVHAVLGNDTSDDNDTSSNSQIAGIPKIFPTLPRAPVPQGAPASLPSGLPTRPLVPEGGLGPLAPSLASASSFGSGLTPQAPGSPFLPGSGLQSSLPNSPLLQSAFVQQQQQSAGQGLYPQASVGNDNLLSQLLRTFGLSSLAPNLDLNAVNSVLGLNGGQNAAVNNNPGLLSNVVYSALTDGNVQSSKSDPPISPLSIGGSGPLNAALGNASEIVNNKANAALIQNLLTQPNSPLCNPKPAPVESFNVDSFMGKWYQVLYSPPLSAGPCSMVTYQKVADVGQGGPGTVFDTFEYTTEATPYGKPRVSSGYGIVRGTGQMTYRTTSSASDVNVYVLETGPTNDLGQYDYVVLAVNCNYPLHVFARDPVQYKQKYEAEVNSALEQRSLVTSWSRLLNLVAPVDYNLCTFPPTLFNVRG